MDGDSNIKFYRPANGERKHIDISYFKNGVEYRRTIAFGVNLAGLTEIGEYNFSVLKIDDNEVILSDLTRRKLSISDYSLPSDSIRRMIRQTIIIHFEKEEELFTRNIKTLSLFFIPGIRDFRGENPRIKTIFDEEYAEQRKIVLQKNLNPAYRNYLRNDYDDEGKLRIREGYFSGDRGSRDMKELNGVNIILNNKPKLLSIAEPLRFIFSVWALQEGWDNPNVFTICKLAPTDKETSRRQQVGRGLRLAVDNNGKRQTLAHCSENEESFYTINMLDLVVSGHEKNFIEEIQNEIIGDSITHKQLTSAALAKLKLNASHIARLIVFLEDNNIIRISDENDQVWEIVSPVADFLAANKEHAPPILKSVYDVLVSAFRKSMSSPVENRNRPTDMVGIRAAKFREFEELWKTITQKAKIVYRNIDEEALIHEIKTAFDRETIHPKEMRIIEKTYNHKDNSIETRESTIGDAQFFTTHSYASFITNFAGNENLSLSFCRKLFNTLNKDKIRNDPGRASELLAKIFKDSLHKTIVQGIGYQFDGEIAIDYRRSVYGRQ